MGDNWSTPDLLFQQLHDATEMLKNQKQEFKKTQGSMEREESLKNFKIEDIMLYESYMIFLTRLMEQQVVFIEHINKRLDVKREEYIKASKNKKVIERVKEKQYINFMKKMDVLEQKFLDEIGIIQHVRSHRGDK